MLHNKKQSDFFFVTFIFRHEIQGVISVSILKIPSRSFLFFLSAPFWGFRKSFFSTFLGQSGWCRSNFTTFGNKARFCLASHRNKANFVVRKNQCVYKENFSSLVNAGWTLRLLGIKHIVSASSAIVRKLTLLSEKNQYIKKNKNIRSKNWLYDVQPAGKAQFFLFMRCVAYYSIKGNEGRGLEQTSISIFVFAFILHSLPFCDDDIVIVKFLVKFWSITICGWDVN